MADDFTPIDEFDQDAKFPHKSSRKIGQEVDFIGIKTLTAGSGINIDLTDLENPVISFSGDVLDGLNMFIQSLMVAETQADFRSALGVTEFGNSLVTAVNLAAAFSALEATETGIALLQAANQDAVFDVLGGTVVGKAILQAVDEAAARSAIGVLSTAEVAAAISDALAADAPVTSVAGKVGAVTLNKADVGLDAVDNTADADKPVSDAQANADSDVLAAAKAYTDLLALLVTGQIAFNQNKYLNSWTTETSAADNSWQSVAWSDSLLLTAAVASDGTNRVMVSTNGGGSWTSYPVSGTVVALNAICSGPGKFVAVGDGGYVTSTNGTTWTGSNTSGFSSDVMNAVTYSVAAGLYVAVGNNGKIYTSTNGTTWTSQISGITTNLNSVVYSDTLNRFVAGGDSEVVYSTDGLVWYQANSGLPGAWKSIVWAGELEVPKYFAIGSSGKCMMSLDGTTWAAISLPSPLANYNWTSIAWSGTTLVIVGVDGTSGVIGSSVDGVTWLNRTSGEVYRVRYTDVVWNSTVGKFFATGVGRNSGGINYDVMSSTTGGAWTNTGIATITGNSSRTWTCIEFNGLNGVICTNNNYFASTTDGGITWTRSSVNLGYPAIDIVWSAGLSLWLVAFANTNANNAVKTSADLITWTTQDIGTGNPLPLYSAEWNSTDGLFLLTADNSIYTSPDGSTWTKRTITSPGSVAWQSLVYAAPLDLYVAVGTDEVAVSSNGTAWTRLAPPSIPNIKSIARSATKFVSVGSGNAAVSADGINWTSVPVPAANTWESIAWSAPLGVFVAVSSSGTSTNRIMSSPDGITWTLRISASGNNWKDVTWLNSYDRFVAVAASGTGTRVMTTG